MQDASEANGSHVTRAEHETLREHIDKKFAEHGKSLKFIEQQMRLFGQAMELLLAERGIDMPEEPEDA